jgi:hypothetical protein
VPHRVWPHAWVEVRLGPAPESDTEAIRAVGGHQNRVDLKTGKDVLEVDALRVTECSPKRHVEAWVGATDLAVAEADAVVGGGVHCSALVLGEGGFARPPSRRRETSSSTKSP